MFRRILQSYSPAVVIAACAFLAALLLRLNCLDCKGPWYDEVASLDVAGRGFPAFLTDRFGWMSVQTPLYYFVVWLSSLPIDPTVSAVFVRLPSALAGAISVLALYGIGKETFGRSMGLLAGVALAFSAVHIGYSQDLRPYSLIVLFTLLSVYSLLMAERAGERRWWVAFVAAAVIDLYISYFALSLVLPALVPFLAWMLTKSRKNAHYRPLLLALALLVVAAIPLVLDLASVPRSAPVWSAFTPSLVLNQFVLAFTQLTRIGAGGAAEAIVQWVLFALALLGLGFGARDKKWGGVILCASFLLVPSLLMAVFRTSNTVFQRYILFTLPFYLLLVANGVLGLWTLATERGFVAKTFGVVRYALMLGVVLPFVYSSWVYFDTSQYRVFGTQPDYRGVSAYLQSVARPDDIILVADEPGLGATVLGYYWDTHPPAPFYDVRDPRLPLTAGGNIYLVVSFFQNDAAFLGKLGSSQNNWASYQLFQRAAVLQSKSGDVVGTLEQLAGTLEAENNSFQPVVTLRGSLAQLRGDSDTAAQAYNKAGAYFGTGEEYFKTADGYLQRGDVARAWREAIISKFMQPGNPKIHEWMAARLREEGLNDLAEREESIERSLGGAP